MIADARNDLFIFNFPKDFIPQEIKDKYFAYLNRMPTPIEDPGDIVNATLQGFTFPSVNLDPVTLIGKHSKEQKFRGTGQSIPNKEIRVTFKLAEGYINYWMMYDTFIYYNQFENELSHIPQFRLQTTDSYGVVIMTLTFKEILFTTLSDLTLSYSDNIQQFNDFECTFNFNFIDIKLEID